MAMDPFRRLINYILMYIPILYRTQVMSWTGTHDCQPSENLYSGTLSEDMAKYSLEKDAPSFFEDVGYLFLALKESQKYFNISPCYKNLEFKVRKTSSSKILQTLSIKELKQTINEQLTDCLSAVQKLVESSFASESKCIQIGNYLSNKREEDLSKRVQFLLQKVIEKSLEKLRKKGHEQHAYNFLQIVWKKQAIEHIINKVAQDKQGLVNLKKELRNHGQNNTPAEKNTIKEQNQEQNTQNPQTCSEVKRFRSALAKLDGKSHLKLQLYKLYNQSAERLRSKEAELNKWIQCVQQFEEIVPGQMSIIDHLKSQKTELETYIEILHEQARQSEMRYKAIMEQLAGLQEEIKEINPASFNKVKGQHVYYMNPQFQKNQIQQKMLVELIQLQSDLLLGKNQIKKLAESVIQIIKTSHLYLQDLSATKYCLIKYDKAIYSLIKDIPSLESAEMQQVLQLKDDSSSFVDSYMQQEMKSSFMSINSEYEGDSKLARLSRITTEDSVILSGGNDQ